MNIQTKNDLEKIREEGLKSLYPGAAKVSVILGRTGCIGFCQREPVVDILEPGKPRVFYQGVTPERCGELVEKWLENRVVEDLLFCKMEKEDRILEDSVKDYSIRSVPEGMNGTPSYHQVPFYSKQL